MDIKSKFETGIFLWLDKNVKVASVVSDAGTGTQWFTATEGNTIYLSFRGSQTSENYATDLETAKVSYPPVSGQWVDSVDLEM